MKINKISTTNFKSFENFGERHFITPKAKDYTQKLLWEMNHQTQCSLNASKTEWFSNILTSVTRIGNDYKFTDKRMYTMPTDEPKEYVCDCALHMGKTDLYINSKTGEIVNYKKGFFTTWGNIYNKAERVLETLLENLNNPSIVTKNFIPIRKYTPKGEKLAMQKLYNIK